MYDDFEKVRKFGEDEAKRAMDQEGVDGTRIFDVANRIREILDTGTTKEIAFLQAMLEGSITMIPFVYEQTKAEEKRNEHNKDNGLGFRPERG